MTATGLQSILSFHGIAYRTIDSRLHAENVYTIRNGSTVETHTKWVDVSTWSKRQLIQWLGY